MDDSSSAKDHAGDESLKGARQWSPEWSYFSFPPLPEAEKDVKEEQMIPTETIPAGIQLPSLPVTKLSTKEAYGMPSRLADIRPSEAVASLERVVP